MSHPEVPYDPLLDAAATNAHPLPQLPPTAATSLSSTPVIAAQNLDDPVQYQAVGDSAGKAGVGLGQGTSSTDFGPPNPNFLNQSSRNSYSASSLGVGDRQSGYGSIAPLRDYRDSASASPQAGAAAGTYALPLGVSFPDRDAGGGAPYTDDPSGHRRSATDLSEKDGLYEAPRTKTKRRGLILAAILCGIVVIIAVVVLPVYFLVVKKKGTSGGGGGGGGGGGSTTTGSGSNQFLTTGGDGSIVTKEDGTTFIYNNTLGGYWVYDVNNPLNNSARAQEYSPPMSEQWQWGVDRVYG
jgi:glucan 1,3-beta-glucosidase